MSTKNEVVKPIKSSDSILVKGEQATEQQELDHSKMHLLVVDDNALNRDMLSRRLRRKKFNVSVAEDGYQALHMIAETDFDLILLDVMMPGISGLEVLETLRNSHSMNALPVIMATAKDGSNDIVEALKLGANDYVTKPIDFPVVMARVVSQLLLRQAHLRIKELASQLDVRNQFIRQTFGRYLTDEVVNTVLESPHGRDLGGKEQVVSIMMADLRGFSTKSNNLTPDQVVTLVNNFLGTMTKVIQHWNGTIIEFIGDAILAVFGAPKWAEDDALSAVSCALEMQCKMLQVNQRNVRLKLPIVEMGIGIHTGLVVVGNIGSEERTKYGIVGANVNLSARIESYTIGGQILISSETAKELGAELEYDSKFSVHPKGSSHPVEIYSATGIAGKSELKLPLGKKPMVKLSQPIAIRFAVLDGINVPDLDCTGQLVSSSGKLALIECVTSPAVMSNIKLELSDQAGLILPEQIYGKVIKINETGFSLHFSTISETAQSYIETQM